MWRVSKRTRGYSSHGQNTVQGASPCIHIDIYTCVLCGSAILARGLVGFMCGVLTRAHMRHHAHSVIRWDYFGHMSSEGLTLDYTSHVEHTPYSGHFLAFVVWCHSALYHNRARSITQGSFLSLGHDLA